MFFNAFEEVVEKYGCMENSPKLRLILIAQQSKKGKS